MDGVAQICQKVGQPRLACEDGDFLPRTPDPRNSQLGTGAFEYFTHIDEAGNIWGIGNASGVYLHAGPVDFSGNVPEVPEPGTWLLSALGLCGYALFRRLRNSPDGATIS